MAFIFPVIIFHWVHDSRHCYRAVQRLCRAVAIPSQSPRPPKIPLVAETGAQLMDNVSRLRQRLHGGDRHRGG